MERPAPCAGLITDLPPAAFELVKDGLGGGGYESYKNKRALFAVCSESRRQLLLCIKSLDCSVTGDYSAELVNSAAVSGILTKLQLHSKSTPPGVGKLLLLGAASAKTGRAYNVTTLSLHELPVPLEHAPLVPTAFPRLSQLSLKLDGPLAQTAAALLEACAQAGLPLHTLTIKEEPTRKLTENDQGGEDSIEQRYLSSSGFRHCVPVKYPPVLPAVAKLPHLKSLKLSWMDVEVGTGLTALAPLAGQLTQLCINGNDDNYSFWTEKDVRETIMPGLAALKSLKDLTYATYEPTIGRVGDEATADLLAIASSLTQLTSLDFSYYECGPEAFSALLQLPYLQKLELRNVTDLQQSYADVACSLTDIELTTTDGVDMQDLASLPSCARLKLCALEFRCPGDAAGVTQVAQAFERSRSVRGVRYSEPYEEPFDVEFSADAAGAHMLRALRLLQDPTMRMAKFCILGFGPAEVSVISEQWPELDSVTLEKSSIQRGGLRALLSLPKLESLQITHCSTATGEHPLIFLGELLAICLRVGARPFKIEGEGLAFGYVVQQLANDLRELRQQLHPDAHITLSWCLSDGYLGAGRRSEVIRGMQSDEEEVGSEGDEDGEESDGEEEEENEESEEEEGEEAA